MRLSCPNCKAQYEVEDSVIPEGGRDVQCSACGHTWYQYPLSVALQMRAEELEETVEEPAAPAALSGLTASHRRLDRSVMDLLREEAEREIRERRNAVAGNGLETQGDLGLPVRPARPQRPARDTAEDELQDAEAPEEGAAAASDGGDAAAPSQSRRNLLPDIEELSSTLEPRRDTRRSAGMTDSGAPDDPADQRRGLRRGLSVVVIVAGVLLALYLLAPMIAEQVPALEGPMAGYVALVNTLRAQVATWVAQLLALIGAGG
ncbi:MAG: zinc-ribbon domain-containing protein [Pararhodobacter sp.]|nr:zinc-ribbon domain-containing protein [Pararhodobacter sp.]